MGKWKHFPAILFITGDQVVSKSFRKDDSSLKKNKENPDLLWSLVSCADSEEQILSFLRKETIEEFIDLLENSNVYILDKWVMSDETPNREKLIADYYENQFKLSVVRRNTSQINLLSQVLYYKIRLPILLCFFMLLLANFLYNTRVRQEYESVQSELYIKQRNSRQQQNAKEKKGRVQIQYQSIPDRSFALIADRIGSYVPPQVMLSSLIISPLEAIGNNTVSRNKEVKFRSSTILINPHCASILSHFLKN